MHMFDINIISHRHEFILYLLLVEKQMLYLCPNFIATVTSYLKFA